MTDVRETTAPSTVQDNAPDQTGAFIWYELMTTDAEGAKAFYDKVVGWDFGEGEAAYQGYRMINRKDGGFAGGVMPLTAEMQQHGARPTWLGYIYVPDVDQAVGTIEAAGGKTLLPATDIPNVGRIAMVTDPQGAPFYVMKPIPPQGDANAQSDVFSQDKLGTCGWNELSTTDASGALDFYTSQFGWEKGDSMPMGGSGRLPLHQSRRPDDRSRLPERCRRLQGRASALAPLFPRAFHLGGEVGGRAGWRKRSGSGRWRFRAATTS